MKQIKCSNCYSVIKIPKYEGKYIGWKEYKIICGKCYRKLTKYDNHWFSGAINAGGRLLIKENKNNE